MALITECYIAPATFRRWIIAKAGEPFLAWGESGWAHHRQGIPLQGMAVFYFDEKMAAFHAAHDAGFAVRIEGYCADEKTITCYRCGMTSYNPNDVLYRYCGNCHKPHEN
jgi:hypothetical protein